MPAMVVVLGCSSCAVPPTVGRETIFDCSHAPAWERSPGRSSARFGPVRRHGMLADTFPVGRIGDAAARTMDRCRWGRIRSVMPVTWGFLANDRACRPAAGLSGMVSMVTLERGNDQNVGFLRTMWGLASRPLTDGQHGYAGASQGRSHAGAWERSKSGKRKGVFS